MNHLAPDFKTLSFSQREAVLKSLFLIARSSEQQRPSGITQLTLIHAIGTTLLGISLDDSEIDLEDSALDSLHSELRTVSTPIRHRLFQLFILVEMILDPPPKDVSSKLRYAAAILNVDDGFIDVLREYSQSAYGIAATDLHRKGYLGKPGMVEKGSEMMRCNKTLTDPFEVDEDDPVLLSQWLELENCNPDTLGRKIWEYYMGRGFVFTGQKGSVNPTIAQHDWVHLLADYSTTIEGELEVFSFIGSAIPDLKGFSFLLTIVALFETGNLESWGGGALTADPGHLQKEGMPERVADAIRRGRVCNFDVMYGIDYFNYKDEHVDNVRKMLNIIPKDFNVTSPGVWHPEGITEYQRENGDHDYQPPLAA
ncbi:MAG: hypothetical protein CL862_02950 [Cyanobium sp. NAT70]|nr:hypothetical protein [Cyanobium sp. NAT70]